MVARVDELTINSRRSIGWIVLCLPFVVSLGTTATRSDCAGMRVTDVNVASVIKPSFEGSCTRVSVAGVKRTWTRGCTGARPESCTVQDFDPMPMARWIFGVVAAASVLAGLWRRSLAAVTIDFTTRTVRVEAEGKVAVFPIADRPEVVKDKRRYVVRAGPHQPIFLGGTPDPRDLTLLRESLAAVT